ncbi:MAG: anti-sigma factor domain-containing protein, partial [Bacillota bacterium]
MKEGIIMFRKQGLIAKIKDNYCIVVTREGSYKKVPVPAGGARPGMEISYRDFDFYPLLKPVLLA